MVTSNATNTLIVLLLLAGAFAGCAGNQVAVPVSTSLPVATTDPPVDTDAPGDHHGAPTDQPSSVPTPTTSPAAPPTPVAPAVPSDPDPPFIPTSSIRTKEGSVAAQITFIVRDASLVKSYVEYGLTDKYGAKTSLVSGTGDVQIDLSSLQAEKTYHFRVCSTDETPLTSCSPDLTFITVNRGDNVAPRITDVSVWPQVDRATINWTVIEDGSHAETYLLYGLDGEHLTPTTSRYGVGQHSFTLTGLVAETTYLWRAFVQDAAGNPAGTATTTFTTPPLPDTQVPVISDLRAIDITMGNARIEWSVADDKPNVKARLEYYAEGSAEPFGLISGYDTKQPFSLLITPGSLMAEKKYFYRVRALDLAGHEAVSAVQSFTTLPPPVPQLYLETIKQKSVTPDEMIIFFQFSGMTGTTAKIEYGQNGAFTSTTAPVGLAGGARTNANLPLSGLNEQELYNYRVVVKDPQGREVISPVHEDWSAMDAPFDILGNLGTNSYSPSTLSVQAGLPVKISITNKDEGPHSFTIYGSTADYSPAAGESWVFPQAFYFEPGTYTVICTVPGHNMRATITSS